MNHFTYRETRTARMALAILAFIALSVNVAWGATTLLPDGVQCFQNANGPLSSGSLNTYVPNTTTPKTTWKDSGQATANTDPIQLDANGCAIIYGIGVYRFQIFDGPVVGGVATGNLVYDVLTTDTSAFNSVFWAGLAGGTPNIITITDTGFNATDGTVINFIAKQTNTASATLNPSGYGNIPILKDTTGGPVSLIGSEIVQGNLISVVYYASTASFHLANPPIQSTSGSTAPLCGASGLKIVNDGSAPHNLLDLTANNAVTLAPTGGAINRSNISVGINFSINGAGGLDTGSFAASTVYYVWLIDNGAAVAGLASLSSTSPTMPSGYTYKCRMAAVPSSSSTFLFSIITLGAHTTITQNLTGTPFSIVPIVGNCPTGVFVAEVFSLLPVTATEAKGFVLVVSGASAAVGLSSNAAQTGSTAEGSTAAAYFFNAPLTTASTLLYCSSSASNSLFVSGWTDAVNAN